LAALLSFLWPGLGQLYTGKRRLAAIFAVPALLVLLLLVYELRRGPLVLAAQLLAERNVGLAAVVIVILVGAWRLASVTHAFLSGETSQARRRLDRATLAALAVVIVVSHLGAGFYLLVYSNAGNDMFDPNSPLIGQPALAPSLAPGQTPYPTMEVATLPPAGSRVTILFTGMSSGGEQLYDTIMVVSYDPKTNSVQMVSVPRDSASFPFYFGGTDPISHKINELPKAVDRGWIKSPDGGYTTLIKEVGYLVGIPINFSAIVDLQAFVKLIDAVGGIDVDNPSVISDGTYDWLDGAPYGFYLAAGPQHLDGKHALAYARSRHGADGSEGNNDFKRADRQQQVLISLLHKMSSPSQILNLPNLTSTVGSSITTNFPRDKVADYIAMGQDVPSQNITNVVLSVPEYGNYFGASNSCLYNYKVAAESIKLFGQDSTWYGKPPPANTCP
jgi:LCP family protein required for cell wall assembly